MSNVFNRVGAVHPGHSVFNLSYEKKLTADMGLLYPIMCEEVVPGDVMSLGNEIVVRMQPMVAPMLHEVNVYVHYFFCPYRLLWDDWEEFITGGVDGEFEAEIPKWIPTDYSVRSLWDYFGFPIDILPTGRYPIDFPKRAYNFVYNEYYRDETLVDELDITISEDIQRRAWEKDYFTSALPWQQRGTAPALPISGTTSAVFPSNIFDSSSPVNTAVHVSSTVNDNKIYTTSSAGTGNLRNALNSNTVDLSVASTFDIADLRLAFQVQRWLERNARAGARYTEFLTSHFGVSPRDERLDRPEYIGGSKDPVVISEVLQTSSTDATSAQGNLAGHGLGIGRRFVGKYRVKEFGCIIGIMSIMPRTVYSQGINRQWLRETKYDFYFPEFANLSEQAIERVEIYASSIESENKTLFGYQGRYDEMRVKQNMTVSDLRPGQMFDYWTLARDFDSAPALNKEFIECNPSKRTFAVQDEPVMIVQVGNIIKAARPMPIMAEPGLLDHI